jgi:hypothetical protein
MHFSGKTIRLIAFLPVAFLMSCSEDEFTIGEHFIDSSLRSILIDTCTIKLTTVSIDSVVTSGMNTLLTGSYSDTTFGKTECTAYVAFSVPGSATLPDADIVFDSIDLTLTLNGTWLGDTLSQHSFEVHCLDEVIELPEDGDYYSSWSIAYENEPLATSSFKPHPLAYNTITVRLPDGIGMTLLKSIVNEDEDVIGSQDRFMEYFKGIAITPANDNNVVLGFSLSDSTTVLRIHYHYSTLERTEGIITIAPLTERCFYGVVTDRSGTPFSNLGGNELSSKETGNKVLVQALTGSYIKIEFPWLNNLLELGDYCNVTDATLMIYPVRGTYSKSVPLPENLSMYISNENNVTLNYITTYTGDALQTGNLVIDDLFNIDTYYSYDITSFLQGQLGAIGIYRRCLKLIVPQSNLAVTLNTMVAGGSSGQRYGMKLKISYLIYEGK